MASDLQKNRIVLPRQSLAESTARVLTEQIDLGRWCDFLPGERELCNELQISRPTLRQALKILEQDGWLKTEPSRPRSIVKQSKTTERNNLISVLSPSPLMELPPFAMFWVDWLRLNLSKCGYQLKIHSGPTYATQKPERALDLLTSRTPSALWLLLLSTPQTQDWFAGKKLPCLVAGSCATGTDLPSVDIDHYATCRHAAGILRRAGHNRLALVIPAEGLIGDAASEAGFCDAAPAESAPLILRHDGTRRDIIRHVESCLRLNHPPTGYLVARSTNLLTVLTSLMHNGIRLPQDAAIISRDNDFFLDSINPKVARYSISPEKFARKLFHIVLQMLRAGIIPKKPVRLIPDFSPGETV